MREFCFFFVFVRVPAPLPASLLAASEFRLRLRLATSPQTHTHSPSYWLLLLPLFICAVRSFIEFALCLCAFSFNELVQRVLPVPLPPPCTLPCAASLRRQCASGRAARCVRVIGKSFWFAKCSQAISEDVDLSKQEEAGEEEEAGAAERGSRRRRRSGGNNNNKGI